MNGLIGKIFLLLGSSQCRTSENTTIFRITKEDPGCIVIRTRVEDQLEGKVNIRMTEPLNNYERLPMIHPAGLNQASLNWEDY